MTRTVLLVTVLLLAVSPARAASPDAITRLVAQLGSDEFAQREAARKSLLAAGAPALAALERAVDDPDAEVARLAKSLVSHIEARVTKDVEGWGGSVQFENGRIARVIFPRSDVADEELKQLAGLPRLHAVSLYRTRVTDEQLKYLAAVPRLRELDLGRTPVTDAGLKHLAGLKKLETLHLGATAVTGEGLKHLAGLENLRSLDLSLTKLTPRGRRELARLGQLESLFLSKVKLTETELDFLKNTLRAMIHH